MQMPFRGKVTDFLFQVVSLTSANFEIRALFSQAKMPKLNRSLFLLLLVNLASSDDCFVDKDGLVTFVGKSNTASAQLAIKGKALSMKFKKIGSLSSTGIKVTFDFGGCKIFAYLEFKIKGPYILFNDRPTRSFYFTVKSELSHNCYGL